MSFYNESDVKSTTCHIEATFSADGLPTRIPYGNGVVVSLIYDEQTRLLTARRTIRQDTLDTQDLLEDIYHCYGEGRLVHTFNTSEQSKYFRNCTITLDWKYTYNAIGHLLSASGRNRLSSARGPGRQLDPYEPTTDAPLARGATDGNRLCTYEEKYEYDLAGNITSMQHTAHNAPFYLGLKQKILLRRA